MKGRAACRKREETGSRGKKVGDDESENERWMLARDRSGHVRQHPFPRFPAFFRSCSLSLPLSSPPLRTSLLPFARRRVILFVLCVSAIFLCLWPPHFRARDAGRSVFLITCLFFFLSFSFSLSLSATVLIINGSSPRVSPYAFSLEVLSDS